MKQPNGKSFVFMGGALFLCFIMQTPWVEGQRDQVYTIATGGIILLTLAIAELFRD